MITCMECKHYPPNKEWPCVDCLDHDRYEKPLTNADRIRAMSDEELADELLTVFAAFFEVEWSKGAVLDWLKQEVKE